LLTLWLGRVQEPPKDALDTLVLNAIDLAPLDKYEQIDFVPFDPTVKRTEATIKGPDGKVFKVTKGAPHVLLEMTYNKDDIRKEVEETVLGLAHRGIRSLAVSCTDHNSPDRWVFMGIMTFLDPPRPDTKITIQRCKVRGCPGGAQKTNRANREEQEEGGCSYWCVALLLNESRRFGV
jgi:H+-transporting ATPase